VISVNSFVKRGSTLRWIWLAIAIAIFAALPLCVSTGWVSVVSEMLILAIATSSLNLLMGYTGLVSFGPAGLYAVGAYATALLIVRAGAPFGLAFIAGPIITAMVSVIVGWFCVRRTAIYFALLTLAFSQLIHTVIFKWYSFTGGADGIVGIPVPSFLFSINNYYYFTLACTVVCLLALWVIVNSPFGKALQVIRENPERAAFIGINVRRYQLIAFVIHGFFLGAAGSLFCGFSHSVFPTFAHWMKAIDMIIACLLGGMFNFFGPVVGSIAYTFLNKIIINFTEYWPLVLGTIVVLLVLFLRGGMAGFISEKFIAIAERGEKS